MGASHFGGIRTNHEMLSAAVVGGVDAGGDRVGLERSDAIRLLPVPSASRRGFCLALQ